MSDEEVIEAAKSTNIHNFIESLPMVRLIHLSQSRVTHILTHTYTYTYAYYAIRVHIIYDIIIIFRSYTIMYDILIIM